MSDKESASIARATAAGAAPLSAFECPPVVLGNVLGDHGAPARQRQTARRRVARAATASR